MFNFADAFPERTADNLRRAQQTTVDAIIRQTDAEFWKLAHNFAIGDRVRVKETGHRGKITNIDQFSRHHVLLDSHHSVHCSASELEPEDYPASENAAPLDRAYDFGDRVAKATVDAIIRDDCYGFVKHTEAREESGALAKSASGFKIGQRVRDKWGFVGKITAISKDHADITYENGIEGTVLVGYFKAA